MIQGAGGDASPPAEAPALAVLTGDIVRSSALAAGELDEAMATLEEAAGAAARWRGVSARFTRFRGDGWQCLAPEPALAMRTALFLRAALRRQGRELDTRISVGFGSGELPEAGLAAAAGPAFRVAGHGLDRMVRQVRLTTSWADPPPDADRIKAIFVLCDAISRRWTAAQAAILLHALEPHPPIQAAIAAREGISQQMVAKHLYAAGDWAIQQALEAVEQCDGGEASA